MTRLVRAELQKVFSTRMVWGLLAGLCVLVALSVVAQVFAPRGPAQPPLDSGAGLRAVYAGAGGGFVFALALGILGMTGEFRHLTVTASFLAVPRRGRVVAAKVLAHAVVGALYAVTAAIVTILLAVPLLVYVKGIGDPFRDVNLFSIVGYAALATALYTVVGVGVGVLVRNVIAAILVALAWVMLVEALIVAFLPKVGKWLPGGAASAMLESQVPSGRLLEPWQGALLFTAYGVAFALAGTLLTVRRDVT